MKNARNMHEFLCKRGRMTGCSGVAWAFLKLRTFDESVDRSGVRGSSPIKIWMHKSNLCDSGLFQCGFSYIISRHNPLFILNFFLKIGLKNDNLVNSIYRALKARGTGCITIHYPWWSQQFVIQNMRPVHSALITRHVSNSASDTLVNLARPIKGPVLQIILENHNIVQIC